MTTTKNDSSATKHDSQADEGHHDSNALRTIRETVDSAAGKVFGEPVHRDGLTMLPVAAVTTGGGGGGGHGQAGKEGNNLGGGEGGGFGVVAKPAGAFVIKDGTVSWRPALDLNRVVLGGQIVAIVGLFVLRGIVKARSKRRRMRAHHRQHHLRAHRHLR